MPEPIVFSSLDSHRYQLEGKLHASDQEWGAIVCHPHPLYGGTMDNKVVDFASRGVEELGGSTLKFNFRGVERSEGHHGGGEPEVYDLLGAVSYLKEAGLISRGLILIGYSFGSFVISKYLASGHKADGAIFIAPPLGVLEFSTFPPPKATGIHMVLGAHDSFCSTERFERYANELGKEQTRAEVLINADHFFHGEMSAIADFVRTSLENFQTQVGTPQ